MDHSKRNKQNYLKAKAAFNARDLDACVGFYAPNHRLASSREAAPPIRRFFEETIAAWPDTKISVEHAVAEDDWVMGRCIATATHATAVMGVSPTMRTMEAAFWDQHRFDANGLIVESWNLMDALSIMQQIKASDSARTIASYESYAPSYAALVNPTPAAFDAAAMQRLASVGGTVLEIGSGPGFDADYVETLGVRVDRTDITRAFLDMQAARGKQGRVLNVITDDLGGPYDGVMALCVLIHVSRDQTLDVLRKIAGAIRPGGAFLASVRDGDGETFGDFHTVYWRRDAFAAQLEAAGFVVEWDAFNTDRSGEDWLTFLARKPD